MIKKPWVVQVIDEYIYTAAVNGSSSQPYSYMLRLPFCKFCYLLLPFFTERQVALATLTW